MNKLYMTGYTNYVSHAEAVEAFNKTKMSAVPAALEHREPGPSRCSWIAWLSDKPMQLGQVPFVGVNPQYNEAAEKLRNEGNTGNQL